jgi:Sortase and related acyltransferases
MNYTYRPATHTDIARILEIYSPYVEQTTVSFEYTPPTLAEFTERFNSITAHYPWLVCETNSGEESRKIVGYAYGSRAFTRTAYNWSADISVYIDESHHRLGIGHELYTRTESILALMGYVNLYAVITGTNAGSLAYHEAVGYEKFAVFEKSGFKFGEWIDTVWYRKILNPHSPSPTFPTDFSSLDSSAVRDILDGITEGQRRP